MTVRNHPPTPHPMYFPPAHPGGSPPVFQGPISTPGAPLRNGKQAVEYDRTEESLSGRMAGLSFDHAGSARDRNNIPANQSGKGLPRLNLHISSPFYEGWTFTKADPEFPGQQRTWRRANRSQMGLSQSQLSKLVQKKAKKSSVSKQYASLPKFLQAQIDRLIDDRNREDDDLRFEWCCAYAQGNDRLVLNKNARSPIPETVSAHVVIKKRLRDDVSVNSNSSSCEESSTSEIVDLGSPVKPKHRPFSNHDMYEGRVSPGPSNDIPRNVQWGAGVPPRGLHSRPAPVQHPVPVNLHPTLPPPPHPPAAAGPENGPGRYPHMGVPFPQAPPPQAQPFPGLHGSMGAGPGQGNNSQFGPRTFPANVQGPEYHPPPRTNPVAPTSPSYEKMNQPKQSAPKLVPRPRSPKLATQANITLTPDNSNTENDGFSAFDQEYKSSVPDMGPIDDEPFKAKRRQQHGSLHHRQQVSPKRHWAPVYRPHCRPSPSSSTRDEGSGRGARPLSHRQLRDVQPRIVQDAYRTDFRSSTSSINTEPEYAEAKKLERQVIERLIESQKELLAERVRSIEQREKDLASRARKMERMDRMERLEEALLLERHRYPGFGYYPRVY